MIGAAAVVGGCQGVASPTPVPVPTDPPTPIPASPTTTPEPRATPQASATPTATPTAVCTETEGQLIESSYPAVAVAGEVPLLVYLPPCYEDGAVGYPTAYLLHGLPYDQRHWLNLGVTEQADSAHRGERWQPMILVLPYLPEPLFTATDGGPGSYEQEFLEGLVPYIERNYRADPGRRGLAGISRGGVWALEIGLRNPQDIAGLAALSPALAVNSPRPAFDPFELARSAERFPAALMLLAGDTDWAAVQTAALSRLLDERGIDHQYLLVPGDHSDPTWESALEQVLSFLSQALDRP